MSEELRRNDPCSCGSGKKYKKCCMNKQQVVEMQKVKEERFFHQKHQLTMMMNDFITEQVNPSEFYQLESTFKKRAGDRLEDYRPFAQFWMNFFHRFENGLRGIEWFLQEQGHRLGESMKTMAETWVALEPVLVQAVEELNEEVVFEDLLTGEHYRTPKHPESVPPVLPWFGTLGLLEPMEEGMYYFNGMKLFVGPENTYTAKVKVREWQREAGGEVSTILRDYYPELIGVLKQPLIKEDDKKHEIKEYTSSFKVEHHERAEAFFYNDHSFMIDEWNEERMKLSLAERWKVFQDNEIPVDIYMADIKATLVIENDILTVTSNDQGSIHAIMKKMENGQGTFAHLYDDEQVLGKYSVQLNQKTIQAMEEFPYYFGLYAQQAEAMDVDATIPTFEGRSLRQLVQGGECERADTHLKQHEYINHYNVRKEYGEVDVTPDLNTVRKELGLRLSRFVTGGADRRSSLQLVEVPFERETYVTREDARYFQELGFTPITKDLFFAKDMVDFYREKGVGKSSATKRKYRKRLEELRYVLETQDVQNWSECEWDAWIEGELSGLIHFTSNSAEQEFRSVVRAFQKWLVRRKV